MVDEVNLKSKFRNSNEISLKTTLIITIRNVNLNANDENFSPYFTVQLGSTNVKRTKTKFNKLNEACNEKIKIEYLNTIDGVCDLNGELIANKNIIIRSWDEENDVFGTENFLGQIVLNLNNLVFNANQELFLKQRTESSKINGSLIISIDKKINNVFYLNKYYLLVKEIFNNLFELDNHYWLLKCVPNYFDDDEYFACKEYSLLVKQYSNKYGVCSLVRNICHFNELVNYFIKEFIAGNRRGCLFSKIAQNLRQLINMIDSYYQNIFLYTNEKFEFINDFMRSVQQLPIQLLCIISNYRVLYSFDITSMVTEKDELSIQLIELNELIQLTSKSCLFCFCRIIPKPEYIETAIASFGVSEEFRKQLICFDYSQSGFEHALKMCIIESLKHYASLKLFSYKHMIDDNSCCTLASEKLKNLSFIINEQLPFEIDIENKCFAYCFAPFITIEQFDVICSQILIIDFLTELMALLSSNVKLISKFRFEQISAHLNCFILVRKIFYEKVLKTCRDLEIDFQWETFAELFQPFLLEFIRQHNNQFIQYHCKIDEAQKVETIEINNENDLSYQKCLITNPIQFSNSVIDMFSKFYEILSTILNFEMYDVNKNGAYQLEFAKLVKNEVLKFVVCLKNRFLKSTSAEKETETFIYLLINSILKIIELCKEIEIKLSGKNAEISNDAKEQFKSLACVLKEDLTEQILQLAKAYNYSIYSSCFDLFQKLMKTAIPIENVETVVLNMTNETIFKTLNEKFNLCQGMLFDDAFQDVVALSFKIVIKAFETLILYDQPSKKTSNKHATSKVKSLSFCKAVKLLHDFQNIDSNRPENEVLQYSFKSCLNFIVDFFSTSKLKLSKTDLMKTKEYSSISKTLDLFSKPTNELTNFFIEIQEKQQDTITDGKLNMTIQVYKDIKRINELCFKLKIIGIELNQSYTETSTIIVEVVHVGPSDKDAYFASKFFKLLNDETITDGFKEVLEFRIDFQDDQMEKLKFYEFNIILKNSKTGSKIALSILNFSEIFHNQLDKQMANFELSVNLWLPLKLKLKVNSDGLKILEILNKRKNSRKARDFVGIKKFCLT